MKRHFYDVGANVGQTFDNYLLPGLFRGHEVFCFEPSPRHLSALRAKAEAVSGHFRGITIIPAAVGGLAGMAPFYEKTTAMSDSLVKGRRVNLGTSVAVLVPVLLLSAFILARSGDAAVDVKIDTEGAEYEILADLLACPDALARVRTLHVEWHEVDGVPAERRATLTNGLAAHGIEVQRWPF